MNPKEALKVGVKRTGRDKGRGEEVRVPGGWLTGGGKWRKG